MPRVDYTGDGLSESELEPSPYLQAKAWVEDAITAALDSPRSLEPTAICVATVDAAGHPNVRTVLMRFFDERGPGFVTNLGSTKSEELRGNPWVAATLTWPWRYRAIRFRGRAELLGRQEVHTYFDHRPYGARLSAWASRQSRPVDSRAELEQQWAQAGERFPDTGDPEDVPVPDFWGGWRIRCDEVEFWAGRANRLHDRIVFTRTGEGSLGDPGSWVVSRRQP
ncbi:pyridoxamine 5'-phosphate oxidase [Intrasporangium sp.]|uniref:pyridoxamine 5'-phosphate oxidase n=1 Tax=Intrasporangium sp. TaxID=1925024 RepID=UPI0032214FBF